jgi:hypothetical protein
MILSQAVAMLCKMRGILLFFIGNCSKTEIFEQLE